METVFCMEIAKHGFATCDCGLDETPVMRSAPGCEEPADNDPGIKEVSVCAVRLVFGGIFKRENGEMRIPRLVHKKQRGADEGIQCLRAFDSAMNEPHRAYGVARNLGGDGGVLLEIGTIVSRYTAVGLLNSRTDQPAAGAFEEARGRLHR